MNETLVKVTNLSFKYKDLIVLDKINLEINRGDFVGLIGPNGSGKTTLLKTIVGLATPTSGSVSIFGSDPKQFKDRQKLGYVPQKAGLLSFEFPVTVEEVVKMGLVNIKTHGTDAVRDALNAVSMHKYRHRLMSELSGGQQQRIFIARALIRNPELIILDEPTVGVDESSQKEFYDLLRHLNVEKKLTLILVSHDIDVISKEVKSIVCLNVRLLGHVTPSEFKREDFSHKIYGENLDRVVHNHNH